MFCSFVIYTIMIQFSTNLNVVSVVMDSVLQLVLIGISLLSHYELQELLAVGLFNTSLC